MDTEQRIDRLEDAVRSIEQRNARVETDKAWEMSRFRMLTIAVMTYVVVALFLMSVGLADPWINALVPTIGYFLSTQSIPVVKRWWIARRCRVSATQNGGPA